MNVSISTHDVHREQLRFLQLGPEGYDYRVRNRIKDPKKFVAVLVYLSFRVGSYRKDFNMEDNLREFLGAKLAEAGITSFVVKKSRPHVCETDKTYRIDEFVQRMQEIR